MSAEARGIPEFLEGDVIIRSAAEGPNYEFFLDVKEGPGTPDGVADRLWILQREPPRRVVRPMRIDGAHVYSRRGELIVAPPVGPYALAFSLGDFPLALTRNLPPDWMERRDRYLGGREVRQRFVGVGLIHRQGSWPIGTDGSLPPQVTLF